MSQPTGFQDDILDEFKFQKVFYLLPNTVLILQPMDQKVISNFEKTLHKALAPLLFEVKKIQILPFKSFGKVISTSKDFWTSLIWHGERITRTLNSVWKKLWPDAVAPRGFEEFELSPEP